MERHFVLPLTIAAVLHSGLLFGIRGGPAALTTDGHKSDPHHRWHRPIEFIFSPPPEPDQTTHSGGVTNDRPPILPEPPVAPRPTEITFVMPPRDPTSTDNLRKIPDGQFGPPGPIVDGWPPGPSDVLRGTDLDSPPRTRLQVPPVYPFEAKRDGRRGEVLVEFTVDESGAVLAPRVVRSSDRVFEEPTLRAVSRWRFEPGRRGGQIVRFRMAVPVVFNLNEN